MAGTSTKVERAASTEPAHPDVLELGHRSRHVVPSITAGLVGGILTVIWSISFATLIFSGPLEPHVRAGLALALIGGVVLNLAGAWGSSVSTVIPAPQEVPAVVVAVMAASIVSVLTPRDPSQVVPTILAVIAITSLTTGAFFCVLGALRLGRLVRFVPFPVIGGFLAGTGWLIVVGAVKVLTGISLTVASLPDAWRGDAVAHMLPAVLLAIILTAGLRRFTHFSVMPALLLASIIVFYLTLTLVGLSPHWAQANGWLIGPLASGSLYPPFSLGDLQRINWPIVAAQTGSFATIMVASAVALLLNVSGLEVGTGEDLDVDRELRSMGIGNMVAGLGGGLAGFHSLSTSLIVRKVGSASRLIGLTTAAVAALALVGGTAVFAYFPRFVAGALLLYLGVDLLVEWIYRGWFTMSRLDYAMVVLILVVIGVWGVLQGLIVGIVLGIILFVVAYSRLGAVKHELSGATYHSNVDRSPRHRQLLYEHGDSLYILTLQGFLFFGTTSGLLEQIHRRLADSDRPIPRFIVLDCRLVTGVDASVAFTFTRLRQLADKHATSIILTGLAATVSQALRPGGFVDRQDATFRVFPDLDRGVEWCENQILRANLAMSGDEGSMVEQLADLLRSSDLAVRLMHYLERVQIRAGVQMLRQGSPSDTLYLIELGRMAVLLERPDGSEIHLRTIAAGAVVGEIGFYLGLPAAASVVPIESSVVYRLTRLALSEMEEHDPALAITFSELIVRLLAERLVHANETVGALLD
ncbi:MAG TPA: SulP family inorganic anion transporter [Chloroflexota bacterium]